MGLINLFKKKNSNRPLTLNEKWAIDSKSYKGSNENVETGECQCYRCDNRIKGNTLKCSKFDEIDRDILFGKKECEFLVVKKENE